MEFLIKKTCLLDLAPFNFKNYTVALPDIRVGGVQNFITEMHLKQIQQYSTTHLNSTLLEQTLDGASVKYLFFHIVITLKVKQLSTFGRESE